MEKKFLSVKEVAKELGVTPATVAVWCREGKCKAIKKHGRWWIAAKEVKKIKAYAYDRGFKKQYMRKPEPPRFFGTIECPRCSQILVVKHEKLLPLLRCPHCGWKYNKYSLTPTSRKVPKNVRRRVLDRADGRCELCGREGKLELHHLFPRNMGGANHPSNIIALCCECHSKQFAHGFWLKELSQNLAKNQKTKRLNEEVNLQRTQQAFYRILEIEGVLQKKPNTAKGKKSRNLRTRYA